MDPKKASDETMELKRILTQGSNKCGGRDGRFETVAASGATHTPVDVRFVRS